MLFISRTHFIISSAFICSVSPAFCAICFTRVSSSSLALC
ncbi:membrane or secreted protein [gut metagenome]|uniref:Membrane or secreted protein n=1 Tax=gut metagenome TaxID=749906 RepID=J9CXY1_9ZZZZ